MGKHKILPEIGYGSYHDRASRPDGWWEEAYRHVLCAIQAGYRLLDTASGYLNEREVGQAVRDSGVPRETLFLTTKVRISEQGYDETLYAFEQSLKRLGMSSVDLYMAHWPVPEKFPHTYRAMERLYEEGAVRHLGISNFQPHHFEKLMRTAHIKPEVVQLEIHPYLTQESLIRYYREYGLEIEAWSPLGKGGPLQEAALLALAKKYCKKPAQILLRWHLQKGIVPLPKASGAHITENLQLDSFVLTDVELQIIDRLNCNRRCIAYPDILKGEYDRFY